MGCLGVAMHPRPKLLPMTCAASPRLPCNKQELFASGLRSGYVRTTALQRGTAPAPLVQALLSTMTQVGAGGKGRGHCRNGGHAGFALPP